MLEIKNLTKNYNDFRALDKVSFTLKEGEITGFLGPNGAGKTTALRILTGFLDQSSGTIKYSGKSFQNQPRSIIKQIGYLPEDNPLYNDFRVDDFLIFCRKIKKGKKSELKEIINECGLKNVLTKRINELSKGYRQRVGLAKALIGDPKFLLLDEPTTGLDPNQKQEILKLIKNASKNRIVLFSSHILSEVSDIADRVIIIHEGKIVADDKAKDLAGKYLQGSAILVKTNCKLEDLRNAFKDDDNIKAIIKKSTGNSKFVEYEFTCLNSDQASLKIFETVVKNKWKLTKLYTKDFDLEDVFRKLTT